MIGLNVVGLESVDARIFVKENLVTSLFVILLADVIDGRVVE